MPAEITTIETRDGHCYAVTRTTDGRELSRAACDGDTRPDGTVIARHTPPPPLESAIGKVVSAISHPWEREVLISFSDGSNLILSSDIDGEIGYDWRAEP